MEIDQAQKRRVLEPTDISQIYRENRQNNTTCRPCMDDSHRPHRTPRILPSSRVLCDSLASRPQQIITIIVLWTIDLPPLLLGERKWRCAELASWPGDKMAVRI